MELSHQIGQTRIDQRPHDRLHEGAIEREVVFDTRSTAAKQRSSATLLPPSARMSSSVLARSASPNRRHEIRLAVASVFRFENRLIETGRQRIDQIDIAGELVVLFSGNLPETKMLSGQYSHESYR